MTVDTARKIVVNRCFGGFGVSEAGMRRYAELKGIKLWVEPNVQHPFLGPTYWVKPPADRPAPLPEPWAANSQEERAAYNEAINAAEIYDRDIPRDDPALVQAVEELGDAANDDLARLEVVTIPSDIEWEIDDYDGRETIHEKHLSW